MIIVTYSLKNKHSKKIKLVYMLIIYKQKYSLRISLRRVAHSLWSLVNLNSKIKWYSHSVTTIYSFKILHLNSLYSIYSIVSPNPNQLIPMNLIYLIKSLLEDPLLIPFNSNLILFLKSNELYSILIKNGLLSMEMLIKVNPVLMEPGSSYKNYSKSKIHSNSKLVPPSSISMSNIE